MKPRLRKHVHLCNNCGVAGHHGRSCPEPQRPDDEKAWRVQDAAIKAAVDKIAQALGDGVPRERWITVMMQGFRKAQGVEAHAETERLEIILAELAH